MIGLDPCGEFGLAPRFVEAVKSGAVRVLDAHARFAAEGWAAFADAWPALDALAGREIDIHLGDDPLAGRALGVDADGALRAEVDGEIRTFHGGEVSVRPARTSAPGCRRSGTRRSGGIGEGPPPSSAIFAANPS